VATLFTVAVVAIFVLTLMEASCLNLIAILPIIGLRNLASQYPDRSYPRKQYDFT